MQLIDKILKMVGVKDLLAASQVCKYWRAVSLQIIADSVVRNMEEMDLSEIIESYIYEHSVIYKHLSFRVSFFKVFFYKKSKL